MPPPRPPPSPRTAAETTRLRRLASPNLLVSNPPTPSPTPPPLPPPLRNANALDIVKRNASRKRKYLFVFPGDLNLTAGAKLGELTGLDTRNPILYVNFPCGGRVKMLGTLVFPKNTLFTVKRTSDKVVVGDVVETLVVFVEWSWIGNDEDNPGQVPRVVPEHVKERQPWKKPTGVFTASSGGKKIVGKTKKVQKEKIVNVSSDDDDSEEMEIWKEDEVVEVSSAQEGSNRRRRRSARVDYSSMLMNDGDEDEDGDIEEDDQNLESDDSQDVVEVKRPAKRSKTKRMADVPLSLDKRKYPPLSSDEEEVAWDRETRLRTTRYGRKEKEEEEADEDVDEEDEDGKDWIDHFADLNETIDLADL